jgi:hypothetical protein
MNKNHPTLSVRRALAKLGADIKVARLKRRIPMALLAERAFIGLSTLEKIQKGDPGVAIGSYASTIFSLGMGTPFGDIVNPAEDEIGLTLEEERLPKRIHGPHRKRDKGLKNHGN